MREPEANKAILTQDVSNAAPGTNSYFRHASLPPAGRSHAVLLVNSYTSLVMLSNPSIVVIDIIGLITKYGNWLATSTVRLNQLILCMAANVNVKGIILNIDSPGGQAAGTADLVQTIIQIRQSKPIISLVQDGTAASAAYWIFSAATEGYLTQPTDQIGSIGAYRTFIDLTAYYKQNGIDVRDIYAPQSTDKNQPSMQAGKGNDNLIKEDLSFLVDHFIKSVKANRGDRLKITSDNQPFTGKMYNAAAAIKFGLADGIKSLSQVVSRLEQLISTSK